MSRVGRMPIPIPAGVQVEVDDGHVRVSGPKGALERSVHPSIQVALEDGRVVVRRQSDDRYHRALHGLTRALIANMVEGVTRGYQVELEIHGVGYRAQKQGQRRPSSWGSRTPWRSRP